MSSSNGVALVTGSAQGIGRAIALKLADDGFDVAVNDIIINNANLSELANEIRAKGRRALEVIADVSEENEVRSMVETTVRELGGVDVVSFALTSLLNSSEGSSDGSQCGCHNL
jgi:NAD(P)-dependent dehydrogenase (short-subunit alcohol dehydrogenase family)